MQVGHLRAYINSPPLDVAEEGKHCVRGGFLIPGCYEQPCPYSLSETPHADDPSPVAALLSNTVTGYLSRDSYHCIIEPTCFRGEEYLVSKVSARSFAALDVGDSVMRLVSSPVSP